MCLDSNVVFLKPQLSLAANRRANLASLASLANLANQRRRQRFRATGVPAGRSCVGFNYGMQRDTMQINKCVNGKFEDNWCQVDLRNPYAAPTCYPDSRAGQGMPCQHTGHALLAHCACRLTSALGRTHASQARPRRQEAAHLLAPHRALSEAERG